MFEKTPMIKINYQYHGNIKFIYVKLEYYHVTGSIKDRVAYYMLHQAKKRGNLKENMMVTEATSGNTGISLVALASAYHHPSIIFMPDWVSRERKQLMESYGGTVVLYSKEEGGFERCMREAKDYAEKNNGFYANQFANPDNILAHYETTGKEIIDILPSISGFISGIGTGGTLMGIGKRLKENYPDCIIAALEPDTMALLSGGTIKTHQIEGIGDDFIPDLVDQNEIDTIIQIHDEDAILMAQKLSSDLGLGVGISSGANFLGAMLLNEAISGNVVTIFPDDSKKYFSTSLFQKQKKSKFIEEITLLSYEWVYENQEK